MARFFWGVVVPVAALALAMALTLPALWVGPHPAPDSRQVLPERLFECRPEPLEQLRYLLAITVVPVIIWLGAISFHRLDSQGCPGWLTSARANPWPFFVQLLLAVFLAVMLVVQETKVHAYFSTWQPLRVLFQFGLLVLTWQVTPGHWKSGLRVAFSGPGYRGRLGQWLRWQAPWQVALIVIGFELLPSIYHDNSPRVNEAFSWHLSFTLDEFAAVLNGRTPRVDFFPQYQGVLAYLLAPLFRIIGLSATTFTGAMTALSALGFLLFFWMFRKVTGDPWKALLLFLPFLWVSLVPVFIDPNWNQRTTTFNYFAVGPIRYIGPWITAALLTRFLLGPSLPRMIVLYFAATLAALNNLDFGVPALVGAIVAVLLTSESGVLPSWRSVGCLLGGFVPGAALALTTYLLITWLRSGRLPDLAMVLLFQRAFVQCGFYMLPMPAFGFHWVIYLTFMATLARALFGQSRDRLLVGLLLFSGVFGCGALAYYVGRSSWSNLVAVFSAWAFSFMLLAWSKWQEWRQLGQAGGLLQLAPLPALLIGFGYLMCWSCAGKGPNLVQEIDRLTAAPEVLWPKKAGLVKFLREHAGRGEKVGVIYPYGYLLSLKAGVDNVFPFANGGSLILKRQLEVVLRTFDQAGVQRVFGQVEGELADEFRRKGFRPVAGVEDFVLWERGDVN